MYRGYPVGYFLLWLTGAEGVDTQVIGDTNKQKAPSLLIVDGQQRLTSLYAVIRREAVLRENLSANTSVSLSGPKAAPSPCRTPPPSATRTTSSTIPRHLGGVQPADAQDHWRVPQAPVLGA